MIIIFLITNSIFSQEIKETKAFSRSQFSFFGGLCLANNSDIFGSVYAEGATNLYPNLYIKLSIGYYRLNNKETYKVKTYKLLNIGSYKKYHTLFYDVLGTEYQIIPISVGFLFSSHNGIFRPYAMLDFSYNLIDPLLNKTQEIKIDEYDFFDQIPSDYLKTNVLPNGSYGLAIGIGCKYLIVSGISLNLRYFYKIDTEILNSHQILIGVTF